MTPRTHRMNITLPAEVHDSLKDYSEFLGKPPATVVAELIKEMHPSMLAVSKAMKKAKKSKEKGIEELRKIVLQEIAATALLASTDQADFFDNKQE